MCLSINVFSSPWILFQFRGGYCDKSSDSFKHFHVCFWSAFLSLCILLFFSCLCLIFTLFWLFCKLFQFFPCPLCVCLPSHFGYSEFLCVEFILCLRLFSLPATVLHVVRVHFEHRVTFLLLSFSFWSVFISLQMFLVSFWSLFVFALNLVLVVLDFCVYEFVCFLSLSSFGGLRGILFMFSDIFTFWFSFLSFCFWLFLLFFRYFCLLNLFILLL